MVPADSSEHNSIKDERPADDEPKRRLRTRYLTNEDDVFTQNAWDSAPIPTDLHLDPRLETQKQFRASEEKCRTFLQITMIETDSN